MEGIGQAIAWLFARAFGVWGGFKEIAEHE
jgi:hypothetical protein